VTSKQNTLPANSSRSSQTCLLLQNKICWVSHNLHVLFGLCTFRIVFQIRFV